MFSGGIEKQDRSVMGLNIEVLKWIVLEPTGSRSPGVTGKTFIMENESWN